MGCIQANNIYSFCIYTKPIKYSIWQLVEPFGKYFFMYDTNTPITKESTIDKEIIIFGDVVNVITGQHVDIAKSLLEKCSSVAEIVNEEKKLGGQYIMLFRDHDLYYLLGDATTSIPVFYSIINQETIVSCYDAFIAKIGGFEPDKTLLKIRKSANESQPMPSDITIFREIKALLPNHYLQLDSNTITRFVNAEHRKQFISAQEAASLIDPMIYTLARYYSERYDVDCPITGGKDSRVVLAYFRLLNPQIRCYTIQHSYMHNQEDDLIIPKEIAKELKLNYSILEDVEAGKDTIILCESIYGEMPFSINTLSSAVTVKMFCKDNAMSDGDIIGQIGKGSLHRDIPELLASPFYFRCKLHNYCSDSLQFIKDWMTDVRQSKEHESVFDLFSIENRLGRWAGQSRQIHNLIGQRIVNIFNSRSIIYNITQVSRKNRMNSAIHTELLRIRAPELVSFRYTNTDGVLEKISKVNGITFYLGSIAKYYKSKYRL